MSVVDKAVEDDLDTSCLRFRRLRWHGSGQGSYDLLPLVAPTRVLAFGPHVTLLPSSTRLFAYLQAVVIPHWFGYSPHTPPPLHGRTLETREDLPRLLPGPTTIPRH